MRTVAVVGAGFSGTMVAIHLLRTGGVRVVLFEQSGVFGPGLAYATRCAAHLLNVPVGRMSAVHDSPDDFLRWGLAHGHAWAGGSFAPRREYGKYLQDALNAAEALGTGVLERVSGEVVACRPRGGEVSVRWCTGRSTESDGQAGSRDVDAAVLALGNFPPAHPAAGLAELPEACYARDPWAAGAIEGVEPTSPVLLVGTGLTMFDVAIALVGLGHRGPIHALSRRGLMPQPHRVAGKPPASHAPPKGWETWDPTARAMLGNVRREIARASRRGIDWREVITSLRSVTPALWRTLPEEERARFLRHVRPFWEIVRHRSAPSVDGQIQEMLLSGRLHVHAARIVSVGLVGLGGERGVDVRIALRGVSAERSLRVARVINCTGPETDCRRVPSPLVRQMREDGVAIDDPLGQGLVVDHDGHLVGRDGQPWPSVCLIGPLAKAGAWEITAVPELREHAARLAAALRDRLVRSAEASVR